MQSVRQDFELMCLNALVFNKETDEYWVEAKNFEVRGKAIFQALNRRTQVRLFTIYLQYSLLLNDEFD